MTPSEQSYRVITLTQAQITFVDEEEFDALMQRKWHAHWNPCVRKFYAKCNETLPNGSQRALWMHRVIMGLKRGDPRQVDHIRPNDTLDNRKSNLRIATHRQNSRNQLRKRSNKSGFKGVTQVSANSWRATIQTDEGWIHLGCRPTAERAYYELYVPAVLKYHGEFANLG